jgi:hypothetical protein
MRKQALFLLMICSLVCGVALTAEAVPVTGQSGPGGIESTVLNTSTLELWLDAAAITGAVNNTPIANWSNRSTYTGAAAVATQGVAAQRPLYIAAVPGANNQPAVRFDGNPGAGQGDQFAVSSLNLGVNASGFVVYLNGTQNNDPGSCCRTLFSENTGGTNIGNNGYALYVNRGDVVPKTLQFSKGTGAAAPALVQNPFNVDSQFHLTSFRSTAANTELRDNGTTLQTGVLAGSPTGTNYLIAANLPAAARSYAGDIGEMALFNRQVNLAELPIIENYLSAKYNIAISGNLYSGDNAGIDYDRDVFGVGRVNPTNQALNSGSAGFGIQVTGGVAANQLNDGEFVLAGHKTAVASIIDASPVPEFGGERWSRVWNVDTNGGSVDATLGFNFADAGLGAFFDPTDSYQLLYSDDQTFASYQILDLGFTIDPSNTITFNVPANLLINGYYTLGINATFVPEPNSMLILLGVLGCGILRRRKSRNAHSTSSL